jgi:hydrogenase nickel incorporation protein HypA/HybF
MHEVGLMREALDLALQHAAAARASRVHAIGLRIGPLSGVVPEALAMAFEVVTEGTPAAGARLVVEECAVTCRCAVCNRDFAPEGVLFACPACGTPSDEVRGGRELEVAYVEVS